MKSWKRYEKLAAEWYGDNGIPCTRTSRGIRGEAGDDLRLTAHAFSIEVKTRRNRLQTLSKWMGQAKRNANGLTPIVHFHADGTSINEDLIILSTLDFVQLLHRVGVFKSVALVDLKGHENETNTDSK